MSRWHVNGVTLEEEKFYTNTSGKTRYLRFLNRNSQTFKITVSWAKDEYSSTRLCSAESFVNWLKS